MEGYVKWLGDFIWQRVCEPALRLFADADITLLRRVRHVVSGLIIAAVVLLLSGIAIQKGYLFNAAGIMFNIAGVLRLFLAEEIERNFRPFQDEQSYPHGPPSVAMRELIMPEAGPYTVDSEGLGAFYYSKRGVLYLLLGFVLQFVGTFIP